MTFGGNLRARAFRRVSSALTHAPMDFSGWFEVFLGGAWYTFDARFNTPRIGRIVIAHGRDAADVAISPAFGPSTLVSFRVFTDELVTASA